MKDIELHRAQRVPEGWLNVLEDFEKKERSPFQAYLAAGLANELRAAMLASTPAPAQQSGWTEESGLVLDFANRVELSCYDQGSAECMAAVQQILDGKDRGDGVANEPWESIRRRLISLVAPAPAQQEPSEGCDQHWSYYFKVMGCKAKTAQDGDCICWHTEGTGPFDMVRHDDADQFLEWRESPSSAPAPAQQEPAKPMDAHRAAYFMRRFLHEEKMLGPNEQAALHFTIAALEAMESAAQHQEPPQQERKPMTDEVVREGFAACGAGGINARLGFVGGVKFAERHHGIKE